MARVLIKPITVRLIAYGQKANIAAIRSRACDLLKDEHGASMRPPSPCWMLTAGA